ncbi:G-protein coupled receptor 135 [Narcine bancroftii]|uniref:G-protein coupled receptor 135 n=1 Tax=Narcine bancroftii TaxID=1343680 RepID=UPI0038311220
MDLFSGTAVPSNLTLLANHTDAAPREGANAQADDGSPLHGAAVASKALLLLFIFLLSSLGNAAVIAVIVKHRQLRTVTNALIVSLSLSDLLTALLCVPFAFITLFSDGVWVFGDRWCVANGFFNSCFGIISTLTMTLISFDRYHAIVRQPREKMGKRLAAQLLAGVWLTAGLVSFPWYLLWPTPGPPVLHKKGFYHCMDILRSDTSRMGAGYSIALIVTCYLLPFSLMCFCHYHICKAVRLSEIRVRPVTTYAHLLRFYSEMRTATTVLIMIVFIIGCWGPYCVLGIVTATGHSHFTPVLDTVAVWLAWSNGALNPLIYASRNPSISLLWGSKREDGYRTRNLAAYLSQQNRDHEGRGRADRTRERCVGRQGTGTMSSSSPANGEVARWACKNPAVLFCRDGQSDTGPEPGAAKSAIGDTTL